MLASSLCGEFGACSSVWCMNQGRGGLVSRERVWTFRPAPPFHLYFPWRYSTIQITYGCWWISWRDLCEGPEADHCHRETSCVRGWKVGSACSYFGKSFVSFSCFVAIQNMSPSNSQETCILCIPINNPWILFIRASQPTWARSAIVRCNVDPSPKHPPPTPPHPTPPSCRSYSSR